jgi:hypothetical protein
MSASGHDATATPPRQICTPSSLSDHRASSAHSTPISPLHFERSHSLTKHLSSASPLFSPGAPIHTIPTLNSSEYPPTLRTSPLLTLRLFCTYVGLQAVSCAHGVVVHPITAVLVYPTLIVYGIAKLMLPPHAALHEFEVRFDSMPTLISNIIALKTTA